MTANLSDVFFKNLDAYNAGEHLIINQGGQGSSKTYSILQLLYLIAKKETKRITVASYALPHLKQGAMADFDKILESFGENPGALKNVSESTYYVGKSSIEFFGIEGNIAKAHGPRRDILFINECNRKITYEVYDQLSTRTQGAVFLDFNPDQEFWLHEKVLPYFSHVLIKSSFIDNPWLPDKELQNILAKKDKPGFENWWRVYGMGEIGKFEGSIFQNWEYGAFDKTLPAIFGLDFGYNDPDAMVKIAINQREKIMYWDEQFYISGNTPDQLKQSLEVRCTRNDLIIADAADARMIAFLKRWFNIRAVDKSKWTVSEALRLMQNYRHIITEESVNLTKEMNNYLWSDKRAGIPIDGFDHLIDPGRYVFMTQTKRENITGGLWHRA